MGRRRRAPRRAHRLLLSRVRLAPGRRPMVPCPDGAPDHSRSLPAPSGGSQIPRARSRQGQLYRAPSDRCARSPRRLPARRGSAAARRTGGGVQAPLSPGRRSTFGIRPFRAATTRQCVVHRHRRGVAPSAIARPRSSVASSHRRPAWAAPRRRTRSRVRTALRCARAPSGRSPVHARDRSPCPLARPRGVPAGTATTTAHARNGARAQTIHRGMLVFHWCFPGGCDGPSENPDGLICSHNSNVYKRPTSDACR